MTVEEALSYLAPPIREPAMSYATLDHMRAERTGFGEVVYCPGKTDEQIASIVHRLAATHPVALATRATHENYLAVKRLVDDAIYFDEARVIAVERAPLPRVGLVALVSAGTADRPIAAEAAAVLDLMGNAVARVEDVGVAGLHRVLHHVGALRTANAVVVVAGMDGALPAVVAGLTDKPVIAVPTSIGYGASFGGLAALLTMLNSCAGGVSVVNIDGGFNGGHVAGLIARRAGQAREGSGGGVGSKAEDPKGISHHGH